MSLTLHLVQMRSVFVLKIDCLDCLVYMIGHSRHPHHRDTQVLKAEVVRKCRETTKWGYWAGLYMSTGRQRQLTTRRRRCQEVVRWTSRNLAHHQSETSMRM